MNCDIQNLHRVVGIDLGTTYSAVAIYNEYTDSAEIIRNPETNDLTTPSVISFDRVRNRVVVGEVAKRNLAADPNNTVIEIKREMGELFLPETLAKFDPRGLGGFRAKQNRPGGYPGDPVRVRFIGEWFMPQEISAFTLMKMKWIAEEMVNAGRDENDREEILDAVITVPAYFTERQRKATEEAAFLAGLYPRQLISEPTAAAICYGIDQLVETKKNYLVYDLGGGTFDVSIISVEEENIEVIATAGDPRLGGGDFDEAIARWAVGQLKSQHQIDISNDRSAQAIVRYHAEKLKILLSTYEQQSMELPELRPNHPPILTLQRTEFEELISSDLEKSLTFVDTAIRNAEEQKGIRRDDIDAILLVGGSSRIPLVQQRLLDYFQAAPDFIRADADPDTLVARGAATLARKLVPSKPPFDVMRELEDNHAAVDDELNIQLITEHSLGIGVQDNRVVRILSQGTGIPVSVTRGGFVNSGPTGYIYVQVYQGEGDFVFDNELIGEVSLGPMEPKPEGHHKFEVTFSLNSGGLLMAMVNHLNENQVYRAQFEQKTGIGGRQALAAIRGKLLNLYQPGGGDAFPGRVTDRVSAAGVPPPPSSESTIPPSPTAAAGPSAPDSAESGGAPVGGAPAASYPGAAQASGSQSSETAPDAIPQQMSGQRSEPPKPPHPKSPAPDFEYSSADRLGQTYNPPELIASPAMGMGHNAPESQPGAGDPPSLRVLGSGVEVPEQFRATFRRSRDFLKQNAHPRLIESLNLFIDALNNGVGGANLENLGDRLLDVYIECRSVS